MKRVPITGADRHPSGAYHLWDDQIAQLELVADERIVVYLIDDSLECEAIVRDYPGWGLFAEEVGNWRQPNVVAE